MEGHYTSPTQPAVALSFLCILLDIVRSFFEMEGGDKRAFVEPSCFYDGSLNYFHFDRVGGVLTYLKRHFHSDLVQRLGGEHWYIQNDQNEVNGSSARHLSELCMC